MVPFLRPFFTGALIIIITIAAQAQGFPPEVSLDGIGTVDLGQRVEMTATLRTTVGNETYQWSKNGTAITGATRATYVIAAVAGPDAGLYRVTVTNDAGAGTDAKELVVLPPAPPQIFQPPTNVTVAVNQPARFAVFATGTHPLTYVWRKDGAVIPSATDFTLLLPAVTMADAGLYAATITNSLGSIATNNARLTVTPALPPVASATQPGNVTVPEGGTATFFAGTASGSSPFQYQWFKNGTAIAGATNSLLTLTRVTEPDIARYSATITNIVGTATSREATLTLTPAIAVAITQQPRGTTIDAGQFFAVDVAVTGSGPITYQWRKDGTALAGATNSLYSRTIAVVADSGDYSVIVTNYRGSVTSEVAKLIVNPAVPPRIVRQSPDTSIPFNGAFSLFVETSGSTPQRFRWQRNGVDVPGATGTSMFNYEARPSQNGAYTAIVSNFAGSVTSSPINVTVRPANLARILTQPASQEVPAGLRAEFSVTVETVETGPVFLRWLKNGVPVPGATNTTFAMPSVVEADAGDYTFEITSDSGPATSNVARLTVLRPSPPVIRDNRSDNSVDAGRDFAYSALEVTGMLPISYQWLRDGVPLPGQTSSSLVLRAVSAADAGQYVLVASNDGGVSTTRPAQLSVISPTPWVEVSRAGDIIYFLAAGPARIERYDLASERWLPTVAFPNAPTPTALAAAEEGIYVAFGRTLVRRSLDLATETPVLTAAREIQQVFVAGNWGYYSMPAPGFDPGYDAFSRATLQPGPQLTTLSFFRRVSTGLVWAPGLRRVFFPGDGGMQSTPQLADGRFGESTAAPNFLFFFSGSRTHVFPDEQRAVSNAGNVFRTDTHRYAGSVGAGFTDLAFLPGATPVVLRRGNVIALRPDSFVETGRAAAPADALRIFSRGNAVFAFGPKRGSDPFSAVKVAAADFAPLASPAATPPARFSIDQVFLANDGTVFIHSASLQGFMRWSPAIRSFLTPVKLRGAPVALSHQPGSARALAAYADGSITELPLHGGNATERSIAHTPGRVFAVIEAGANIVVDLGYALAVAEFRMVLGPDGALRDLPAFTNWGAGTAWVPGSQRLYSLFVSDGRYTAEAEGIPANGILRTRDFSSPSIRASVTPPLRFDAGGTRIATGDGRVLNADLAAVGRIGNELNDAAWLTAGLYTVRAVRGDTQIQRWSVSDYSPLGAATLRGAPRRILRLSDAQILAVTEIAGVPVFHVLGTDLSAAAPTAGASFAGTYFGRVQGGSLSGDIGLHFRGDRSGAVVVNLTTTGTAIIATALVMNDDGTFVATGREYPAGASRTISGRIAADGSVAGLIAGHNAIFSAARSTGSNAAAGFFQAHALDGGSGTLYAIVGAAGQSLVVAEKPGAADGGAATASVGMPVVTGTGGTRFTLDFDEAGGRLAVLASDGAFANTRFGALRDGVARVDRLANISTRGRAGGGAEAMIAGFVVSGSAPREILIRAIGPALGSFGVSGFMADPRLDLFRGTAKIAENDTWATPAGAAITRAAGQLGAFALPAASADAALLVTLDPGGYTAQVSASSGGPGVALVEVYDAGVQHAEAAPRLVNIATRGRVGIGADALIAGIVVVGNAPKRLLVRAVGPALASFGVAGTLADPVLEILQGATVLTRNDDWAAPQTTAADIAAATLAVGAFPLPATSRDACILLTLQPGNYTAQVTGKNSATGIALVEVYEIAP